MMLAAIEVSAAQSEPNAAASCHSSASQNQRARDPSKMVIPDVEVLDQHGNALHFYTDLIKDKTVAINFIFTNCTTICPPLAATFARLQKEMGDKIGKDVHLISISVDPLTDTPERLKAWGAKFKAGPGWTFVTGEKQEMDKLLNALGAAVSKREDHTPAMIIGNDGKGVWTRTYGLAKVNQIVGVINDVMAGKVDESSHDGGGQAMKLGTDATHSVLCNDRPWAEHVTQSRNHRSRLRWQKSMVVHQRRSVHLRKIFFRR